MAFEVLRPSGVTDLFIFEVGHPEDSSEAKEQCRKQIFSASDARHANLVAYTNGAVQLELLDGVEVDA